MSYFKRFLIFALSALLIVAQPVAYAASPVGWGVTPLDIIIGAAGNTVTAVKGAGSSALQSTIKYAPTAGNVGKHLLKGGGAAALLLAVPQILGDGVDWVLDPANNGIRYKSKSPTCGRWKVGHITGKSGETALQVCTTFNNAMGYTKSRVTSSACYGFAPDRGYEMSVSAWFDSGSCPLVENILPINQVAQKVIANSAAGHAPSQELIKTVIIDDVNAGSLDVPLNTAAVPKADAPAVPDPNNPPWQPGQEVPPFDPSSIIAAIKSVMAAVVNMSGVLGAKIDALMIDLGLKQAETIEAITAGTGEIVAANDRTGAKVAEMVAAIEAIEGNTLDGQVINDAVDRVIANDNARVGDIVAAIEAIEGNTLDGQVINDAVDRVIANDNVNAQAAADAATAAADAVKAADAANTAAVTDAIEAAEAARAADAQEAKEAADAKAAADAAALEWAKEAPEAPTDTGVVVDEPISDFDSDKSYITFTGSCPPKYTASLSIMGATAPFEFDYTPICTVMSYLKPFIVGAGYIAAAYIIAGHSRGSKD